MSADYDQLSDRSIWGSLMNTRTSDWSDSNWCPDGFSLVVCWSTCGGSGADGRSKDSGGGGTNYTGMNLRRWCFFYWMRSRRPSWDWLRCEGHMEAAQGGRSSPDGSRPGLSLHILIDRLGTSHFPSSSFSFLWDKKKKNVRRSSRNSAEAGFGKRSHISLLVFWGGGLWWRGN